MVARRPVARLAPIYHSPLTSVVDGESAARVVSRQQYDQAAEVRLGARRVAVVGKVATLFVHVHFV